MARNTLTSVSLELAALKDTYADLQTAHIKLDASLVAEKQLRTSSMNEASALKTEVDQLHHMIDALPGSIPRSIPGENSWNATQINAMTRLAAWFAVNK